MIQLRSTRGSFIRRTAGATIAASGAVAFGGARTAGAVDSGRFVGTVANKRSARTAEVAVDGLGTVTLILAPDATVAHGLGPERGPGDLAAFQVGDVIAVTGAYVDGAIRATAVRAVYRTLSGAVIEDNGFVVRITGAEVFVPAALRPAGTGRFTPGTELNVGVRAGATRRPVAVIVSQT